MSLSEHSLNTGVIRKVSLQECCIVMMCDVCFIAITIVSTCTWFVCSLPSPSLSPSGFVVVESTLVNIYCHGNANKVPPPTPSLHVHTQLPSPVLYM